MLARRVQRDIVERGRDVQSIIDQLVPPPVTFQGCIDVYLLCRYLRHVKPSYDNFVRPTASHADIVRIHIFVPSPRDIQKPHFYFILYLDCAGFEQHSGY